MGRTISPAGQFIARAVRALAPLLLAAIVAGCSSGGDEAPAPSPAGSKAPEAAAPPAASGQIKEIKGDPVAGKKIYFRHCHFCHGETGLGDGPVGIALTPHPADFVHDAKRMKKTDAELFKSITEGIKKDIGGEAMTMPRWKDILTEKERWDVLSFVRQLEREGKKAAGKK